MAKETVLVTDGQLRSSLAIVRSLGRRDVRVICGESTRFATALFSRYTDETVLYPSPESKPEAFVSFVENLVRSRSIDAVLPVGHETTHLICKHQERLSPFTDLPVPDYETFEAGWDKGKTFEAASRADVPRPRTECPDSPSEAVETADDIGFPLVVKARNSSGSRGLEFVEERSEFEAAYESVHSRYPNPLLQERIPQEGRMLGAAFLYDDESEVRAQFACEFLREYPPSGGPSTLHRSIEGREIREYGRRLLDELDWEGIALVEFKHDPRDDTPKLMEVNPRFWSSLHLPLFAGVDFPWLVLQHAHGNEIPETRSYTAGVYARYMLPGDLLHLAAVHDREALREFFPLFDGHTRYEIPNRDDPGPAFGRLAAMGRFALSPTMWRKLVFRN